MNTNSIELFFKDEIKTSLVLLLSPLLSTLWAPLSILAPAFIWFNFKDKFDLVDFYGKEMLNFSLNFILLSMLPIGLMLISPFAYALFIVLGLLSIIVQAFYLYNCYNGKTYHLPYTIRFIKGL